MADEGGGVRPGFVKRLVVVVDRAVGVSPAVVPLDHRREEVHERLTIGVLLDHGYPGVAPPGHVGEGLRTLDPQWGAQSSRAIRRNVVKHELTRLFW